MKLKRRSLYLLLIVLYLLHNDFWNWHDSRFFLGLPVGLMYHVAYCLVTFVVLLILVREAWPRHLEIEREDPSE